MPLYEYFCNNCGNNFEFLVVDSNEVVSCSKCDTSDLKKLFSTFGVSRGGKDFNHKDSGSSSCCYNNSSCACN